MRERPILFSAPMVLAILAGAKTQTRRPVKPRKDRAIGCELACHELAGEVNAGDYMNAPWAPGDRLWVRETHAIVPRTAYAWSNGVEQVIRPDDDHDAAIFRAGWDRSSSGFSWRPSIHMPRWASRITLEVTDVRVERLQDISEKDAQAEGIERTEDFFGCPCWRVYGEPDGADVVAPDDPIGSYRSLWELINGPGSWGANPWVWVVSFRRLDAKEPSDG